MPAKGSAASFFFVYIVHITWRRWQQRCDNLCKSKQIPDLFWVSDLFLPPSTPFPNALELQCRPPLLSPRLLYVEKSSLDGEGRKERAGRRGKGRGEGPTPPHVQLYLERVRRERERARGEKEEEEGRKQTGQLSSLEEERGKC